MKTKTIIRVMPTLADATAGRAFAVPLAVWCAFVARPGRAARAHLAAVRLPDAGQVGALIRAAWLCVWLGASLALAACHGEESSYPAKEGVQFHLGSIQPRAGWQQHDGVPSVGRLYIDPNIVIGARDIVAVGIHGCHAGGCSVDFRFSAAGARRMREVTRAAVGRPMAILVDGRAVAMGVVEAPIGDALRQSTNSRTEAQALLEAVAVVPHAP